MSSSPRPLGWVWVRNKGCSCCRRALRKFPRGWDRVPEEAGDPRVSTPGVLHPTALRAAAGKGPQPCGPTGCSGPATHRLRAVRSCGPDQPLALPFRLAVKCWLSQSPIFTGPSWDPTLLHPTLTSSHSKPLSEVPEAGWQLSGNTFHPGREDRAPPSRPGSSRGPPGLAPAPIQAARAAPQPQGPRPCPPGTLPEHQTLSSADPALL